MSRPFARSLTFSGLVLASVAFAGPPSPTTQPAPATLATWLADKDVVEVTFTGPHIDPEAFPRTLRHPPDENDLSFRLTPGETGSPIRSIVTICLDATPRHTRELLALQSELATRGYALDPLGTRAWSVRCDANRRDKARYLVPTTIAKMKAALEKSLPGIRITEPATPQGTLVASLTYELPGADIGGSVTCNEITPDKSWYLASAPDQQLHLPRLGLMLSSYYQPGRETTDVSPHLRSIRNAFVESTRALTALEPAASVTTIGPLPTAR